jgi:hypothetical protein
MFRLLLLFTFVQACATHQDVRKDQQRTRYSPEVELSLEKIEQHEQAYQSRRERALDRYRRLRELGVKPTTKTYRPKRLSYKSTQPRPPNKPRPRRPKVIHADPEELSIEIEQKLTYFCMKHRKSRRFSRDQHCQKFMAESLDFCKKKFEIDDRNLLYCVEKKIR